MIASYVNGVLTGRFWWLLPWFGHEKFAVLDGGIQNWQNRMPVLKNNIF